jgi:4-carboxymuconolactone decarboxylase
MLLPTWEGDKYVKLRKPRINPVQENEWTAEQRKLMNPLGQIGKINVFKTFLRHPKLFEKFWIFGGYILGESSLSNRDRELAILRIGWLCQAEYEWSQHVLIGKMARLSNQEILRITKGSDADGWSSFDATLLRAVDELHKDAFISDSTWAALAEHYTEQQIMDLVFTVGAYNLFSMALNSFGVQLDEGFTGFPK